MEVSHSFDTINTGHHHSQCSVHHEQCEFPLDLPPPPSSSIRGILIMLWPTSMNHTVRWKSLNLKHYWYGIAHCFVWMMDTTCHTRAPRNIDKNDLLPSQTPGVPVPPAVLHQQSPLQPLLQPGPSELPQRVAVQLRHDEETRPARQQHHGQVQQDHQELLLQVRRGGSRGGARWFRALPCRAGTLRGSRQHSIGQRPHSSDEETEISGETGDTWRHRAGYSHSHSRSAR